MIKKNYKNFAKKYEESAVVQKEIIDRLIQRLSLINISPVKIIDIGSGIGLGTKNLIELYGNAELYMLDNSFESLNSRIIDKKNLYRICANFKNIPCGDNLFDFVFSSSALHWDLDIKSSFEEIYRILKPGGLFLFSTYGPDTLIELRSAWSLVDNNKHVNDFYDMHDLGDLMLNLNFFDTVVDSEKIIIDYEDVIHLQRDLKNIGSKVLHENDQYKGLLSIDKMNLMYDQYEKFRSETGNIPATYEVIYGSAWKKIDIVKLNN